MGALSSRQHAGVEEVDIVSNHAYKYPPRSGNYFGSHFIMGGERFDTPQPEAYLFGENADLNFLGSRPTPFPYPPPQANEPTKTLKSCVNIRKESLRFVKCPDSLNKCDSDVETAKSTQFNIEFTFDCDARCAITIYYFCTEDFTSNGVVYTPRDPTMNSETYLYKRGANQQFSQVSHILDPSLYTEDDLTYNPDRDIIPVAIHCVAEEISEEQRQSHTTIGVVERHLDGTYMLKALKQKLYVDGLCYLLQEIYGIENKNNDTTKAGVDEETEDNGSECVICMCDVRDTLILPCRHLCLCNSCADSLRYQANNCPICRAPFRALLQIRALQKSSTIAPLGAVIPPESSCDNVPSGYEAVSLIEALNGPCPTRPVAPPTATSVNVPSLELVETPEHQETSLHHSADALNRSGTSGSLNAATSPSTNKCTTPEFRMSVLLNREDSEQNKEQSNLNPVATSTPATRGASPLLVRHLSGGRSRDKATVLRPRDTVRLVNEKLSASTANVNETADEDSEAEKLSPLLDASTNTDDVSTRRHVRRGQSANDDEEDEDEDDTNQQTDSADSAVTAPLTAHIHSARGVSNIESSQPVSESCHVTALSSAGGGDDSDYYTPEDPPILSPLHHSDKDRTGALSVESTPSRWIMPSTKRDILGIGSLPGTPLSTNSHLSARSSGDSFSSSSSTRHLLSHAPSTTIGSSNSASNIRVDKHTVHL